MIEVISRALKLTILSDVCAIRRMRSWMRLAMPRFAMMKSLVMGPGTPSVRLSPLAAPASSPSAPAPASPPDEPDEEPATSCKQNTKHYYNVHHTRLIQNTFINFTDIRLSAFVASLSGSLRSFTQMFERKVPRIFSRVSV